MATRASSYKSQKVSSSLLVNGVLILICLIWFVPTFGVFVTSFRNSQDIFTSGWWSVFPHRGYGSPKDITLPADANVDGSFQIPGYNGTYTFEQLKAGISLPDGSKLSWYGNKRTRIVQVSQIGWLGFNTSLTLENYTNVLSGREIKFLDAGGNTITRQGNNLAGAFLNSVAVAVPATIIPILIAAFAAYGFAWLNFPGR
ncbi:MAG TPA: hypothetical protein VF498_02530, partial [Anaerolineales bacterium]